MQLTIFELDFVKETEVRMKIKPAPNCKSCRGTGDVLDFVPVPFGSA